MHILSLYDFMYFTNTFLFIKRTQISYPFSNVPPKIGRQTNQKLLSLPNSAGLVFFKSKSYRRMMIISTFHNKEHRRRISSRNHGYDISVHVCTVNRHRTVLHNMVNKRIHKIKYRSRHL